MSEDWEVAGRDWIDIGYHENGGKSFEYIPCLNDNEYSIKFLEFIIKQNLLGWNY